MRTKRTVELAKPYRVLKKGHGKAMALQSENGGGAGDHHPVPRTAADQEPINNEKGEKITVHIFEEEPREIELSAEMISLINELKSRPKHESPLIFAYIAAKNSDHKRKYGNKKGARNQIVGPKYLASLLFLTNMSAKQIAEEVGISHAVVRRWKWELHFHKQFLQNLAEYIAWLMRVIKVAPEIIPSTGILNWGPLLTRSFLLTVLKETKFNAVIKNFLVATYMTQIRQIDQKIQTNP